MCHFLSVSVKLGDETCEKGDKCPEGMACKASMCQCNSGDMTPDKTFCLQRDEKLLTQKCTYNRDECYQKACE